MVEMKVPDVLLRGCTLMVWDDGHVAGAGGFLRRGSAGGDGVRNQAWDSVAEERQIEMV